MDEFVPFYGNARLFIATRSADAPQTPGELALVLPEPTTAQAISLSQAWTSDTLMGTFAYSAAGLKIEADTANAFVDAVLAKVQGAGAQRAFLWVSDGVGNAAVLGLTPAGDGTVTTLTVPIATGLSFALDAPAALSLTGSTVQIASAPLGYTGPHAPEGATVTSATLALDGPGVGVISYDAAFTGASLLHASAWGLQFVEPGINGHHRMYLPFATAPAGTVSFAVAIDLSNPLNAVAVTPPVRSRMTFADTPGPLTLSSGLVTRQGRPVTLVPQTTGTGQPAGLAFGLGLGDRPVLLSPLGDFSLTTDTGPDLAYLMCGMNGTEAITFLRTGGPNGEVLRFTPYQPAFAPRYPFDAVSPVSPQTDPTAPLLDSTYTTSWVSIVSGKPLYVAQPDGAPLYRWTADYSASKLLAWSDQAQSLPLNVPFPLAGYGLHRANWSAEMVADFERVVIAPVRRQLIAQAHAPADGQAAAEPYTTTTPTGQIVTVSDGTWTSILLGKTPNPPKPDSPPPDFPELALCFSKPKPELQQAFQTGSLFLVVANGHYLGVQAEGDGKAQSVPTFNNAVNIGGWKLQARVGSGNAYADYRNVMIVKGRKGKLYDRAKPADSLIANPEKWTQPDFAIPADPADPVRNEFTPRQRRELVVLSQWLQDYFAAVPAGDPDYAKFSAIAGDPNWTGTLILRVDVTDVPADLAGIMAGINDPAGFSAHHLGIEATAVKVTGKHPGNQGDSSMFGLIDYADPKFARRGPARPVRPAPGTTYDFTLLTLGVSFANTAVRRFASLAQLTASTWFDMPVDHMGETGNRFSALLLSGTLQTNDGLPVYSLASTQDALFYLGNDIVRKVEITSAVMSTQSIGDKDATDPKDKAASSVFSLSGFLDFEIVRGRDPGGDGGGGDQDEPIPLDLFSFGSPAGEDQPRSGLAFSNLGIVMTFPPDAPADRVFTFDAGRIQFDIATSTPRAGSLFRQFALEVGGIVSGGLLTPPRRSGYLQVVTDARLTGVERGPWWGIDYVLTMGSAGHLAGQAGLSGHLLTAWSPRKPRRLAASRQDADTYQAGIGLKLPGTGGGAKLISLQSVLRLSIGQLWLRYDTEKNAFLLLLSEIALRVLGLGTLPPGSTLFYLYGDPDQTGTGSGLGWYAMYQREVAGR